MSIILHRECTQSPQIQSKPWESQGVCHLRDVLGSRPNPGLIIALFFSFYWYSGPVLSQGIYDIYFRPVFVHDSSISVYLSHAQTVYFRCVLKYGSAGKSRCRDATVVALGWFRTDISSHSKAFVYFAPFKYSIELIVHHRVNYSHNTRHYLRQVRSRWQCILQLLVPWPADV